MPTSINGHLTITLRSENKNINVLYARALCCYFVFEFRCSKNWRNTKIEILHRGEVECVCAYFYKQNIIYICVSFHWNTLVRRHLHAIPILFANFKAHLDFILYSRFNRVHMICIFRILISIRIVFSPIFIFKCREPQPSPLLRKRKKHLVLESFFLASHIKNAFHSNIIIVSVSRLFTCRFEWFGLFLFFGFV